MKYQPSTLTLILRMVIFVIIGMAVVGILFTPDPVDSKTKAHTGTGERSYLNEQP